MAKTKLIQEHFNSISEMLNVICSRPNNSVMKSQNSSKEGSKSFTGTKSWDEAMNLYQYGYTDILENVKKGTAAVTGKQSPVNRNKIVNDVIGYAPHVPNAILGLPNSMIGMKKVPQKVKTVSIIYKSTANCDEKAETFTKAGIALLSAINMLELSGIRVNLKLCFECAKYESEYSFATVKIKDYREHLDIQKLCFPVAHPSMFRRFGFKWLETCEGMENSGWSWGYGQSLMSKDQLPKDVKNQIGKDEHLIFLQDVKAWKFDARKIIEEIKNKAGN